MLKIKDDVDLRILEKYGFINQYEELLTIINKGE